MQGAFEFAYLFHFNVNIVAQVMSGVGLLVIMEDGSN